MRRLYTTSRKRNCDASLSEVLIKRQLRPARVFAQLLTNSQHAVRIEALNSIGRLYSLAYPEM
jgi:hypothetical protein